MKKVVSFLLVGVLACAGTRDAVSDTSARQAAAAAADPVSFCRDHEVADPYGAVADSAKEAVILSACRSAVARNPTDLRLGFVLAKVELHAGTPNAADAFERLRSAGVCAGSYYLADRSWAAHDTVAADSLYGEATRCRAQTSDTTHMPHLFNAAAFPQSRCVGYIQALAGGDYEILNSGPRMLAASYAYGFISLFTESYIGPPMSTEWSLTMPVGGQLALALEAAENGDFRNPVEAWLGERALGLSFKVGYPSVPNAQQRVRDQLRAAGHGDAQRLVNLYQPHDWLPSRMARTIEEFSQHPIPLLDQVTRIKPSINSLDDLKDIATLLVPNSRCESSALPSPLVASAQENRQ